MPARVTLTTASSPGAVAIIQLTGEGVIDALQRLTKQEAWPLARIKYVDFTGIDAGLAVALRNDFAQLMPHGGPRVVQKLIEHLIALGCVYDATPSARDVFPEATSELEADMLAAIARAASPAAIDLLLRQPDNWKRWIAGCHRQAQPGCHGQAESSELARADAPRARASSAEPSLAHGTLQPSLISATDLLARGRILDRLIDPPSVVVIGRPNVGKSTLTNRILGRSASIVADMPGTTRDWVAGLAELPGTNGAAGIAVRWMDTPGLRASNDAIEQRAIELANDVVRAGDVVIVMRDPGIDWPDEASLPRKPDIWVMNKIDDGQASEERVGAGPASPLRISAERGHGINTLTRRVIAMLGLDAISSEETWAFSERLKGLLAKQDMDELRQYANV